MCRRRLRVCSGTVLGATEGSTRKVPPVTPNRPYEGERDADPRSVCRSLPLSPLIGGRGGATEAATGPPRHP
eukprot:5155215-Pyramimonas_sp.AAC.1